MLAEKAIEHTHAIEYVDQCGSIDFTFRRFFSAEVNETVLLQDMQTIRLIDCMLVRSLSLNYR